MTNLYFVSGMFSNINFWNDFIKFFSDKGFNCKVVNLTENLILKNACLLDYINNTKKTIGSKDILIGHSMGGFIVQKIAEELPVKATVAIAPPNPKGFKAQSLSLFYIYLSLRSIRYLPYILFKKPFIPSFSYLRLILFNDMDEKIAKKYYHELEKQSAIIIYELISRKYGIDKKKIKSPLLFIGKNRDRLVPCEVVKKLACKYNVDYVLVNGCHFLLDEWMETAQKIYDFIKDC
jgi:pimeloyl-ACP methyl ester carboxylesterase